MPSRALALRGGALALLVLAVAWLALGLGPGARDALGCAFLRHPHTYEADRARATYLAAIEAASVDALFPGDLTFGLPRIETGTRANRSAGATRRIPATLLKAIAWIESNMTMASRSVTFHSEGDALVSFDCGHGIMQITTGMTVPLGSGQQPTDGQVSIATHYANNIARGAAILADKWNRAPEERPIAGTDTNGDPALIENWYFAVWSYNGFTGPGSRMSNHPADPGFGSWPRAAYRCDGQQARNRYPYQELVWGCMAAPPVLSGQPVWDAVPATLPDLTDPRYFAALSPSTFQFPHSGMDMPTPQPAHEDAVPDIAANYRTRALGNPLLHVEAPRIVLRTDGPPTEARATIRVRNVGSGILSWAVQPPDGWLVVDPPAGVALGPGLPCNDPCSPVAEVTISINPTLLPAAAATGTLVITSPNSSSRAVTIPVEVQADFEVGAPGTSRAY
jgi:hypothetical protein